MGVRNFGYRLLISLGLSALATGTLSCGIEEPKITQRINMEVASKNDTPDKYAVLINGGSEQRFSKNMGFVYRTLLDNGFESENIYVLDNSSGDGDHYHIDDGATKKSMSTLFSHLGRKVDGHDFFLVHIDDHGERGMVTNAESRLPEGVTYLKLYEECMDEMEFENFISKVEPKVGIVTTDICYGGGIARRIGKGKFIGISAATEHQIAYGSEERPSFCHLFYQAFSWLDFLATDQPDKNMDDVVSVGEAFEYAKGKHKPPANCLQTPQLVIDPNPLLDKPDPSKISLKD